MMRSVRDKEGKTPEPTSNVVSNYGHITIPRHLRDIVITEYGIAELRSKTDSRGHQGVAERDRLAFPARLDGSGEEKRKA